MYPRQARLSSRRTNGNEPKSLSGLQQEFIPFPDVIEFACLVRLGTLFVVKTKKTHNGLDMTEGNKSGVRVPSAQWNRQALVKSFAPAAGLSFCFLVFLSFAGPGLDLFEMARAPFPMIAITFATFKLSSLYSYFGFASLVVKLGMVVVYIPSKI